MPRRTSPAMPTRLSFIFGAVAVVASMAAGPALADKRVALIIGNSDYWFVARLDNAANDAKLMAKTLRGLGFTIVGGDAELDLDKARFDHALQDFGNQVLGADVALFYYAGHGLQVAGKNFLVPVEANPTKEADVYLQMIDPSIVLAKAIAPTRKRWSRRWFGRVSACSTRSTKSVSPLNRRPAASNSPGCRRRRSRAASISPARRKLPRSRLRHQPSADRTHRTAIEMMDFHARAFSPGSAMGLPPDGGAAWWRHFR